MDAHSQHGVSLEACKALLLAQNQIQRQASLCSQMTASHTAERPSRAKIGTTCMHGAAEGSPDSYSFVTVARASHALKGAPSKFACGQLSASRAVLSIPGPARASLPHGAWPVHASVLSTYWLM